MNSLNTAWTEIVISVASDDLLSAEAVLHMITSSGMYVEDYSDIVENVRRIANIDLIEEALLKKDRSVSRIHVYFPPEESPFECAAFIKEKLIGAGFSVKYIEFRINQGVDINMDAASVDANNPDISDSRMPGNEKADCAGAKEAAICVGSVCEEDWANNWKQYFKPIRVGESILIKPEWDDISLYNEELMNGVRAVVSIDPGMAFGTGGHATTRLCLTLLEKYLKETSVDSPCVLDIGAGSGILSVAAVLLGASSALGVDIDEYAVKNACENASRNGVSDRTRFIAGDLTRDVEGRYSLILANIVADVVIKLLSLAGRFLLPGGILICSGIISERERDVLNAARFNGFYADSRLSSDGWVTFGFRTS